MAIWYRGLCFLPTDDELFFNYLMRRLNREPLPDPDVIHDCDVYGGGDPWKIFGKDRDEKFYVFTTLKKNNNKSRVDRTAGSGTWKGEQSYKIRGSQGEVVGYKKLFTFEPKASLSGEADKAKNGHWIMYEYSKHPHNETECVLCVISNKHAEKVSKKVCRNSHGGMQLEDENRPAKKARPPQGTDANANSLPPMATATATMQRSSDEWMMGEFDPVVHSGCYSKSRRDIRYASHSPDFGCNRDAYVLPTSATSARVGTGDTAYPAFDGGACVDSMMTERVDDDGWMDRLMNMEIDPVVYSDYLSCPNLFANPSEDGTDEMLASTLSGRYNQTWDPTSLHQQRSVAESQDQDAPVTLAWADKFLLG